MAVVREVLTKFGFQVDSSPLGKVEGQLEAIKERIGFLAGVELAKGLFELGERFSSFAIQLHFAAQSAGLTAEQLQKLAFAGKEAGVSQEELQTGMFRLSRVLYDARTGGAEAQKAFYLLGISQQQVHGFRTANDALLAISDRFKQIQDPVQKAALAQQLMGRGSRELVGFLSQGSAAIRAQGAEAGKLGAVIREKDVNALVQLEHALSKVAAVFQAIGASIAAKFAPVLEALINDFLKFVAANRSLIDLNVDNFVNSVSFALGFMWALLKDLVNFLVTWLRYFKAEGSVLGIIGRIAGFVTGLLGVAAAFKAISFAVGLLTSPLLVVAATISTIVVAAHDLWKLLSGGSIKDTWLNKIAGNITGIENPLDKLTNYLADKGIQAGASVGLFGGQSPNLTTNVVVNAHTGASAKDIGDAVKDAVRDHHERVLRNARPAGIAAVR